MKTIIIALLVAFACSAELKVEEEQELMWNSQGLLNAFRKLPPMPRKSLRSST